MTFYFKRVVPVVWFGFVFIMLAFVIFAASRGDHTSIMPFVPMLLLVAVVGYWMMRKLIFDLVDEVLDAGDALIVRSGTHEERIALPDIKNISYTPYMSPPRVTLALRRAGAFGDRVSFCAPISIVPFRSSPIVEELIERVDAARNARFRR